MFVRRLTNSHRDDRVLLIREWFPDREENMESIEATCDDCGGCENVDYHGEDVILCEELSLIHI